MFAGAGTPWSCAVAIGPKSTVPFGVTATGAVSVVGPAWARHGTGAPGGCGSSTRPPDPWASAGRVGWQPGPASALAPLAANTAMHAPSIRLRRPITTNNAQDARGLRQHAHQRVTRPGHSGAISSAPGLALRHTGFHRPAAWPPLTCSVSPVTNVARSR